MCNETCLNCHTFYKYIKITDSCLHVSDTNQCSTANGGCDHECTDLIPDYECSCNDGYVLDSDGNSCNGKKI